MDRLLEAVADWKSFTAVVVGDFMLDQILTGDASRLSPDAPVPVLRVASRHDRPGGAANLCMDLRVLRGAVHAIGLVGADDEGRSLRNALAESGVLVEGVLEEGSRPTTVKRSLIGLAQARHPQKMFRLDFEDDHPLSRAIEDRIIEAFEAALPDADVVCIEDYNKGVCTARVCRKVIELARGEGIPVLVDPAAIEEYSRYRGATAITPNRTEAELATGLSTASDADDKTMTRHNAELARQLGETLELDAVILTLDRHGSLLMMADSPKPIPVPTVAREVYDVTGAGDMMLAALAAARANGIDWVDAVRFANAAAGLEVEIFGVEPIPLEQIHHELLIRYGKMDGKRRSPEQLELEVNLRRSKGERIVFTNGCFDVLHVGHVRLLAAAAATGDFLVVALNSDDSVRRLKGAERPINGVDDRADILAALESVGAICEFDEDTPIKLIERVRPDVLIKGADYKGREVVGQEFVESHGGKVVLIDLVKGRSTTATIEKMRAVPEARPTSGAAKASP